MRAAAAAAAAAVALAGCRQIAGLHDLDPDNGDAVTNTGELVPSNEIVVNHATRSLPPIVINDVATFDTDTGAVTGALVRAQGEGVIANIEFTRADFGGMPLSVFAMSGLTVSPAGTIKLQGNRAIVFVVETKVRLEGRIDGGGGCPNLVERHCGGPGGGTGATSVPADGCSPGQPGMMNAAGADSGGGGGGGGQGGAAGGAATASGMMVPGGSGGPRCMAPELEPLFGGAGGGAGASGGAATGASGGGGGGALQISAFEAIEVIGSITMAGAGGDGGVPGSGGNGGSGGGGGAGGSVLLEAPVVTITGTVAANGGGGGGGAHQGSPGQPGAAGSTATVPAPGGAGAGAAGGGGAGGVRDIEPAAGMAGTNADAGGGGGGVGRIFLRSADSPALTGATLSPAPGIAPIRTR